MRSTRVIAGLTVVLVALCAGAALAAEDLVIPLKFIPTTKPGAVKATLKDGVSSRAITIAVEDARPGNPRDVIGEGTASGDDTLRIRYAGRLPSYLKATITDRFGAWGVLFED